MLRTTFEGDPWTLAEALFLKRNVCRGKDGKKRMTAERAAEVIGRSPKSVRSFIERYGLKDEKTGRTEALYGRFGGR